MTEKSSIVEIGTQSLDGKWYGQSYEVIDGNDGENNVVNIVLILVNIVLAGITWPIIIDITFWANSKDYF